MCLITWLQLARICLNDLDSHGSKFSGNWRARRIWFCFEYTENSMTISARASLLGVCVRVSAPVTAMSWVPTTAVVFALVATLPLSVPVVRPRPLPLSSVSSMTPSSLVFVFLWWEVEGAAVSVSLPFPLSVPVPVCFDWSAGPWPRTWALPLVTRSSAPTVAMASTWLGVTIAMMAGLGLEVGEEGRGLMSPRRRATTVRARTWARTVGPWATASAVVTEREKWKVRIHPTKQKHHLLTHH